MSDPFRICVSADPGISGALCVFHDDKPVEVFDMPVAARKTKGDEVNAPVLLSLLRKVFAPYPQAYRFGVLEQVRAMPSKPGENGERRGMGATSSFNFGESYGVLRTAMAAMDMQIVRVEPQNWKRHAGLIGKEKDASRLLAIDLYPHLAGFIKRKKDSGRAESMLIGRWANITEAWLP